MPNFKPYSFRRPQRSAPLPIHRPRYPPSAIHFHGTKVPILYFFPNAITSYDHTYAPRWLLLCIIYKPTRMFGFYAVIVMCGAILTVTQPREVRRHKRKSFFVRSHNPQRNLVKVNAHHSPSSISKRSASSWQPATKMSTGKGGGGPGGGGGYNQKVYFIL